MPGVYIQGMELPKSPGKYRIEFDSCGNPYFLSDNDDLGLWHLVPVPDHGRLGDLDRILELIDGIWDCNDMVFRPNDHCCNVPEDCKGCKWVETKNYIRRMVANAPTIILAEEKKV